MRYAVIVLVLCGLARAQEEDEFADHRKIAEWAEAAGEFMKDVRFGEADVKSFFEHFASWDALYDTERKEGEGVGLDRFHKDGKFRFDLVAKDETYVKWAKERGLDPKGWLQKTLRIQLLAMRPVMVRDLEETAAILPEQMKELEENKALLGPDAYAESKASLEKAAKVVDRLLAAFRKLPKPAEEEAKLLEKHKKKLDQVLELDDEGWGEGCGDEDDEGCGCGDD